MPAQSQPPASMTGSGTAAGPTELGQLRVEARAVNGRGLSVKVRTGNGCAGLEAALEERVRKAVVRGTVTLSIERTDVAAGLGDRAQLQKLANELREMARELGLSADLTLRDVLDASGRMRVDSVTSRELPPAAAALVDRALQELVARRREEGARTATAMQALLGEMEQLMAQAAGRAPAVLEEYRSRLLARVMEFRAAHGFAAEAGDLVREVALHGDRIDVSEELQRIGSHVGEVRALLAGGGEVGRRMEFLLQELLREANTLGSKSPDVALSHVAVALKSCIEKLKEQAANLE